MKIRIDRDFDDAPINLYPGDAIQVVYRSPILDVPEKVLVEESVTEPMTIDYAAIVELEGAELKQLGLTEALAGVFGRKANS